MMEGHRITRRQSLQWLSAAAAASLGHAAPLRSDERAEAEAIAPSRLGLVIYCCGLRRAQLRAADPNFDLYSPDHFLAHCVAVGAGGMQIRLGVMSDPEAGKLRAKADAAGLFVEAIVSPPFEPRDVERFDAEMRTAAATGALAARTTIIPGRRYESFHALPEFEQAAARGRRALERAAPIAEKHRVPLAVENHKDQRDDERVALFEDLGSEFVGACVDTGNSFALLEDPLETVRKLAPWAHSVHLKDQAVQLDDDGFLLGDIPLGQGFLDLKTMVALLRRERPHIRFCLELITRDPLRVPCLGEQYWATFPNVPGRDLARTLRLVRDGATDNLQYISRLSPAERVVQEDENVRASIAYASGSLGLG